MVINRNNRTVSLLEKFSTLPTPTSILNDINKEKKPELRAMRIVSWLLYNWKNTSKKSMYLVKPYNPIIGEVFKCFWYNDDGSKTTYVSEQVCHHPPISAFYTYNSQLNMTFEGWCEPKISLGLNSAASFPNGNFRIILHDSDEIFYISKFPSLSVYNIFFGGSINIDIAGEFELTCQKSNISTCVNITKGGVYEGHIFSDKKKTYHIDGTFEIGTSYKEVSKKEYTKVEEIKRPKINVESLKDQADNESRKVWNDVSEEIMKGDFDMADSKKKVIEDDQRKNKKEKFVPVLFEYVNDFGWKYKKN